MYPIPPSLSLRRPCCCLDAPLMVFGCDGLLVSGECGVEGITLVVGGLACFPKVIKLHAILSLGPLHTHPVFWHLVSSYATVGGAHQSDRNPTLDVSARLRVGLFPLGGQATG